MLDPATQATIALVLAILSLFGSALAIGVSAMVSKRLDKIPNPNPPPEQVRESEILKNVSREGRG